jgi:hypothetical protein
MRGNNPVTSDRELSSTTDKVGAKYFHGLLKKVKKGRKNEWKLKKCTSQQYISCSI